MFSRVRVVFSVLILTFGLRVSSAKTVTVPTDASTVKEAVELAQSGDVILIDADTADWGGEIVIRSKDITIIGRSPEQPAQVLCGELSRDDPDDRWWYDDEPPKTLLVENGNLVLQNLRMEKPCIYLYIDTYADYRVGTQMVVRNGNLTLRDSSLCTSGLIVQGSCSIERCELNYYGKVYSYRLGGGPWEVADAALVLGPADDAEIAIHETRIGGLRLDELSNSTVTPRECEIIEVAATRDPRGRVLKAMPGEHAVLVRACTDTVIDFSNCVLQASPGGWSGKGIHGVRDHYGGVGGDGLHVQDSTLEIRGGHYRGGEGAYGYLYLLWFDQGPHGTSSNAGPGGDGIELVRSHVRYRDCTFTRGAGGEGKEITANGETRSVEAGQDGLDIRLDEFSTLQPVSTAESSSNYR